MDLKELSNYYPINQVILVKELGRGNTSDAKLIETNDSKYILRKLKNTEQAMTEYVISKALFQQNICPIILLSKSNLPFIRDKEDVYNLQIFIENDRVKNQDINFYNLGKTISFFHSMTKNINRIYEQDDRFCLKAMWLELTKIEGFNNLEFKTQLSTLAEQCFNCNHENNCYIHGDLGKWNLLFNHNDIYLIDFGEVRKGNNHFDISAVLSSTIDWDSEENNIISSLNDFKNGYLDNDETFDGTLFKEAFTLWVIRGIVAILINYGINEQTCSFVKVNLKMINRMGEILKLCNLVEQRGKI